MVGVGFDSSHLVLPFGFLHLSEEEAHIVGGTTFRILAGCSSLHLPFLPIQFFPQIFTFCQLIVGSSFVLLLINVVISVFFVDGGGSGEGMFEGFGIGEGIVAEFVDTVVEICHHFANSVSESGVFIDENFLGLVFEEIFNARDVDFFTAFLVVLDLVDVQGQRFKSTGAYFLVIGLYFVEAEAAEAGWWYGYFLYCSMTYFLRLSLALDV